MMQQLKKILSLLLVCTMLFGMMVFPAEAAEIPAEDASQPPVEAPTEEPTECPTEEPTEGPTEGEDETDRITGDCTIASGGTYYLADGVAAVIAIETVEPVTIIGNGACWDEDYSMTSTVSDGLYIDCTAQAGVDLTLQDVYIHNTASVTGVNGEGFGLIGFTGTGNTLRFEGVNVAEYQIGGGSNPAGIHVKQGDGLTIGGSGTLYFYKSAQGAGIGGSSGEVNGEINFAITQLFAKGTKQGALIGAGSGSANAEGVPGAISFESGSYNLITNSRGAAIGGSAGATGGSSGTTVQVGAAANININVDYSGAAVGGGGYAQGNDSSGGTLIVNGGSLRTYIDSNAANNATLGWNGKPFTAGVNDAAITARRVNGEGEAVYMMEFDTTQLTTAATVFDVYVDGGEEPFYQGSLPEYGYIQEGLDKEEQLSVTSTPSNWYRNGETNLYFYLTGQDHTLTVNGEEFVYYWDALSQTFDTVKKANVTFLVDADDAQIVLSDGIGYTYLENIHDGFFFAATETEQARTMFSLAPGEYTFTITCDGYYASQGSFQVTEGLHAVSIAAESNINTYLRDDVFTIPMVPFTPSTNADAWDGVTIDVSWYSETADEMHISTPAQLAGLAAIVNGIYNAEITTILDDVDGDGAVERYTPYDYARRGGRKIIAANSTGSTGSNNLVTTLSYWYGAKSQGSFTTDEGEYPMPADFRGQTVYIDCDLDMGGYETEDGWSGARYMTIGGQSLMHYIDYSTWMSDGYSHIGSSFNGTLDGQGHVIRNLYCDRYATGSNYGDSVSVGLVGRLGVHDNDPDTLIAEAPTVRNVAVTGYVYGRRSVGGIVGKTGKTTGGAVIENCLNFANVVNTDAKGVGGICGAGWNTGVIRNCANFGNIYAGRQNGGGICGSCEIPVVNCYNVGYVDAITHTQGQAIGTDNGGATYTNVYWLTGSSIADSVDSYGYPAVYRHDSKDTITEVTSFDVFRTEDFQADLNGASRDWVSAGDGDPISAVLSCVTFDNCKLDTTGVTAAGFPVPRCFIADEARVTAIEKTADPEKLQYVEGQTFDPAGLKIVATWSDGTTEVIEDYTVSIVRPLTLADTVVTISGDRGGMAYRYDFAITVAANELHALEITSKPNSTIYALGETFDPTGMAVKAAYTVDPNVKVTLTAEEYSYSVAENIVTVSYTYGGKTLTAAVELTLLDSAAPGVNGSGSYELYSSNDLLWFANQVKAYQRTGLHAVVMNDITAADSFPGIGTASAKYAGSFDGQGHTLTLNMSTSGSAGLFAYVDGAVIRDVTVAGTVTTSSAITGAAGIAGYVYNGGAVIENCVNLASVSCGGYGAGIVGKTYGAGLTISGCVNEGSITSTGNYAGGIAAYVVGKDGAETVISDCVNRGTVTSGDAYVGGIAGYTKSGVTMTRCCNEAAVSGKYDVGGILGYSADADDQILACCNTASVTAAAVGANHGVGGILGCGLAHAQDVYNLGDVASEAESDAAAFGTGGIVGVIGKHGAADHGIVNAYHAGTVTAAGVVPVGAMAGYVRCDSVMTNCHYLEGSAEMPVGAVNNCTVAGEAMVQTEDGLKNLAQTLGEAFAANAGGYPVLAWQNEKTVIDTGWSGDTTWTLTDDGVLTFSGKGLMKNYGYGGGQSWADYFGQITSVVIEEGITRVGSGAFRNMTALESVTLPGTLTKIGEAAFYGCTGLKEIYIPDGIYTIWEYTFKNCTSLTDVRLPKTLIKIDQGAFENCIGLDYLFVPTDTEIIGAWSFKGCVGLEEVDMQWADATEIRAGAFKNCTALTTIILPPDIQTLGDSAFYGIGASAFTVPATVKTVEAWCFARSALTEITFAGDAPAIGEGAFNKIALTAYYPGGNATWTSDIMQNYGGTVIWTAR